MGRAGVKADRILGHSHFEIDVSVLSSDYALNEAAYLNQAPVVHRKKFAQFFTPAPIAKMMAAWVLAANPRNILDPAVGPGIFPSVIREIDPHVNLTLVDLDPIVLKVAKRTVGDSGVEYLNTDFLHFEESRVFEGIIANPPYLRHHDFSYSEDVFEIIGSRASLKLSKATNIYGLFLLEIGRRLAEGGRAAVVIPTEWTNANYGASLKKYLLGERLLSTLVYFTHESLPFADALTTASVLLLEKPLNGTTQRSVRTIYLKGIFSDKELISIADGSFKEDDRAVVQDVPISVLQATKKWDYLIKTASGQEKRTLTQLSDLASTKRGIATGANEFFHLSLEEATANALSAVCLKPCLGRAADVQGVCFTTGDFESMVKNGRRTHLVSIGGEPSPAESAYLQKGESDGLPRRYLLAARKRWYQMENRPAAPIWAAVFGRSGLRFVRNKAGVLNLTAFHCIYPNRKDEVFLDALVVCLNSRMVQREAAREHRVYGGGLLKAEPKDLLDIWVPSLDGFDVSTLQYLADWLPRLDTELRTSGELSANSLDSIDELIELGIRVSLTTC